MRHGNRARETTATTGTGTITLGGAVTGFQTFANAGIDGIVSYVIEDGDDWEIGYGVFAAAGPTLTRQVILESTNSDNALDLSGDAEVMSSPIAQEQMTIGKSIALNAGQALP
jgi:hypothetical protein